MTDIPYHVEIRDDREAEASVDELQALNTGLCYLCSINAHVDVVERFLIQHPGALLLEGLGQLPDESARHILRDQVQRCECFGAACQRNREAIQQLMDQGFEYFQTKNFRVALLDHSWGQYSPKIVGLEHDVRRWRLQELLLRNRLMESATEVRSFRDELAQYPQKRPLARLACSRDARRSVLEYQVGVASTNLSTMDREHKELLQLIREGRRSQFALLKSAFGDVPRHICTVHQPKQVTL